MEITDFFLNLTSDNPDRMVAFYRDVVGLPLKPEMGPHSFSLGAGGALGIDGHSDTRGVAKEPSRSIINLFVNDVKAERERIEAQGVTFIRKEGVEYWGGVISTFLDPDGNYCQVVEFKPELAREEG